MKKLTDVSIEDLMIHHDDDFIAINKPAGLLSQNDQSDDTSINQLLIQHLPNKKLHLATRLDRPVSGLVLFTRSKLGSQMLETAEIKKSYIAIVKSGAPDSGQLTNYLKRDGRQKKTIVSDKEKEGYKRSALQFEKIMSLKTYDVLKIELETGRFHQIRAQLAHAGFPIKGDVKYGARRKNEDRSIDLHAYELSIGNVQIQAPILREAPIWEAVVERL